MRKIIIASGEYREVVFSDTDIIAINSGVSVISSTTWGALSDSARDNIVAELKLTPAKTDE